MNDRFRRIVRGLTTRRSLVLIGHSHASSVAAAAASAGVPIEHLNFWQLGPKSLIERADGSVELIPQVRARLLAPVFSLVGGAAHHFGLFAHPRAYDFILPERQDLPLCEAAQLVPYDAIHAAMLALARPYLEIIRAVRAATQGPVFHMESPPTYADEVVPPYAPDWLTHFAQRPCISPVWLRYKLWRLHSGIVRDYCEQSDIAFTPCPAEALDARGLLIARYHADLGHANEAYGALVLRQMQELSGNESLAQRVRRAVAAR
jgi:hypothetical protein